jgi:tetratricopeptide (TPR) repeat protein
LPEKAINLLKEQLSFCKDASQERRVNIALAAALYANGKIEEAQEKFDSLQQSEPNDPAPLLTYMRLLKNDKLWGQLSDKVTEWSEKHPQDSNTLVAIARDLAATEDKQAMKMAEDLLREILDGDPNSLPATNSLAMLLQITGDSEEAAKLYQQVLQRVPNNVIAINNLAWIMCEEQGQFQQALELTQKALKTAPQYVDLIDTRGVAYYRLGEFDKAVKDFTECIKLYPSGTPAAVASLFHLARAYAKLGQTDEAVKNLGQALDLQSRIGGLSSRDLVEAQQLLQQLQKGS